MMNHETNDINTATGAARRGDPFKSSNTYDGRDIGPISQEYNELTQVIESIHERVAQLRQRLTGILRPEQITPSAGEAQNGAPRQTSVMADSIRCDKLSLMKATLDLQDLIDRIEL